MKRVRKSSNRTLFGVCAGFSEYFNPELDPLIVRLATVGIAIVFPFVIFLYIILAIVLPDSEVIA